MKASKSADTVRVKRVAVFVLAFAIVLSLGVLFLNQAMSTAEPEGKIGVLVSILPQVYFVERVGGERVNVTVLVGPGQSPHTYEPTPRQMAEISGAQVFFRIGSEFEEGIVPKIRGLYPDLEIVDTRENIEMISLLDHDHQSSHAHDTSIDPHIWLDPKRAMVQAETVARTLVRLDPEHAGVYEQNLTELLRDFEQLDREIAAALESYRGMSFYVFHPAFGYFADSYGLKQVAVEVDGKEPTARQLASLVTRARSEGVKVIFVQPQFSPSNAETVAREIGGAVVPIDPLPQEYLLELGTMARTIREALSRQ